MIYRKLGNTGLIVSAISCGCAAFENAYPADTGTCSVKVREIIRRCRGRGINLFDTSPDYGGSWVELWWKNGVPRVPEDYQRHEILVTKTARPESDVRRLHFLVNRAGLIVEESWRGESIYDPIDPTMELPHVVQLPFNLFDQRHAPLFGKVGVIARSPLLRGRLAGESERALRFSFFSGADTTLVGFRSVEEIDFAVSCLEKGPLPSADLQEIYKMATEDPEMIDPRRWDA